MIIPQLEPQTIFIYLFLRKTSITKFLTATRNINFIILGPKIPTALYRFNL